MIRPLGTLPVSVSFLLLLAGCGFLAHASLAEGSAAQLANQQVDPANPASPPQAECGPDPVIDAPPPPPAPLPPTAGEALQRGVLIVVSIPSQKLFVFKDGSEWGSATVSTGRSGHGTPAGVFSILQKQVHHRSTLYHGAPMPYMQRLTWGGVALHAGHVTGSPASHGCIRLPWDFARKLYAVTNPASTAVLIVRQPLQFAEQARNAASGGGMLPAPVQQARAAPVLPARQATFAPSAVGPAASGPAASGPVQTIQLAAATNPQGADMLWQELSQSQPELQALSPVIIPATVRSVQVYRLRASGQEAHAICSRLVARGVACMKVTT